MVSDKISLHRLHTMFSLLSLKRAYVVTAGRLVGVVAVPELTKGNFLSYPVSLVKQCSHAASAITDCLSDRTVLQITF